MTILYNTKKSLSIKNTKCNKINQKNIKKKQKMVARGYKM